VLVDANILLYAVDEASPFHERASHWLTERLNGDRRVAFPWQLLVAFLRISTHERASAQPLSPEQAASFVADWLEPEVAWIPREGPGHARILTDLITRYQLRGNIIGGAHLAALAIEHGLEVCSNDADFVRFSDVRWINPVAPA
jgi:toxin-antitoxin system PIN domain toxin